MHVLLYCTFSNGIPFHSVHILFCMYMSFYQRVKTDIFNVVHRDFIVVHRDFITEVIYFESSPAPYIDMSVYLC